MSNPDASSSFPLLVEISTSSTCEDYAHNNNNNSNEKEDEKECDMRSLWSSSCESSYSSSTCTSSRTSPSAVGLTLEFSKEVAGEQKEDEDYFHPSDDDDEDDEDDDASAMREVWWQQQQAKLQEKLLREEAEKQPTLQRSNSYSGLPTTSALMDSVMAVADGMLYDDTDDDDDTACSDDDEEGEDEEASCSTGCSHDSAQREIWWQQQQAKLQAQLEKEEQEEQAKPQMKRSCSFSGLPSSSHVSTPGGVAVGSSANVDAVAESGQPPAEAEAESNKDDTTRIPLGVSTHHDNHHSDHDDMASTTTTTFTPSMDCSAPELSRPGMGPRKSSLKRTSSYGSVHDAIPIDHSRRAWKQLPPPTCLMGDESKRGRRKSPLGRVGAAVVKGFSPKRRSRSTGAIDHRRPRVMEDDVLLDHRIPQSSSAASSAASSVTSQMDDNHNIHDNTTTRTTGRRRRGRSPLKGFGKKVGAMGISVRRSKSTGALEANQAIALTTTTNTPNAAVATTLQVAQHNSTSSPHTDAKSNNPTTTPAVQQEPPPKSSKHCSHGIRRSVSFGSVGIREHGLTLGDHPSCKSGAPTALDWEYEDRKEVHVLQFEYQRAPVRKTSSRELKMNATLRKHLLLNSGKGISEDDIDLAAKEVHKARKQRSKTVSMVPLEPVEVAVQSAKRKAKRLLHHKEK